MVLLVARSVEIFMFGTKLFRSSSDVTSCCCSGVCADRGDGERNVLQILRAAPRRDHDLRQAVGRGCPWRQTTPRAPAELQ